VLPLEIYDVSVPNTVLRGIGFRGGDFNDYANVIPLTGAPATEVRGVHPPFWTDVFFPIRTWQANYFDALSKDTGGLTTLALTPVQFQSHAPDVYTGTLRAFTGLDFRLFYNDHLQTYRGGEVIPVLSAAPTIAKVNALASGGSVDFDIYVTGDPNVGIQDVWVTYTCEGVETDPCFGTWQSLDLSQNETDTRLWEGNLSLSGVPGEDIRYMVQAVNGTGLVSLSTNLGYYFIPNVDPAEPPTTGAETTLTLQLGWTSDVYGSYVPMRAVLTSDGQGIEGETVYFALGSQKRAIVTNEFGTAHLRFPLLSEPGEYKVRAAFIGSSDYQESAEYAAVTIEKQPTTLTITPQSAVMDVDTPANFTISLTGLNSRPMPFKTVYIIVNGENGNFAYRKVTNYLGQIRLSLEELPLGEYSVDAYFGGTFTILGRTFTLDDPLYESSMVSGSIFPPALDPIQATVDPVEVGSTVEVSALFSGTGDLTDYDAEWDWGDETTSSGVLSQSDDQILVSGSHAYLAAGVYTVKLTLYDGAILFQEAEFQYIVVYDPSEGFVTGGGWIESPEGAYHPDPSLTGKATFGFVSKYKNGASVPTGKTEFHLNEANLKFRSTEYQWLVIASPQAIFLGTGTINGSGNYGFMIVVIDADLTPSIDEDLFRIKIWDIDNDNLVVYDNLMGTDDDGDLTSALGGGKIKIHKKNIK
jgi:hypothetical protein